MLLVVVGKCRATGSVTGCSCCEARNGSWDGAALNCDWEQKLAPAPAEREAFGASVGTTTVIAMSVTVYQRNRRLLAYLQ